MKVYKRKANDPAPLAQADPYMIKGAYAGAESMLGSQCDFS